MHCIVLQDDFQVRTQLSMPCVPTKPVKCVVFEIVHLNSLLVPVSKTCAVTCAGQGEELAFMLLSQERQLLVGSFAIATLFF